MTKFNQFKKAFLQKYKQGNIIKKSNNKVKVKFNSNGKVYNYNYSSIQDLANKLNIDILTDIEVNHINNHIKSLKNKKDKAKNNKINKWNKEVITFTEEDQKELNYWLNKLENKTIIK